jgi:hypothetical protein
MAIAHVKSDAGTGATAGTGNMAAGAGGTTKSFTYTASATGNAVLLWVSMLPASTSPTTCSLSATGWAFTQIGGIVDGGTSGGCAAIFRAYAPNTSQATITMTWNQTAANFYNDLIDEFSGADTTNFVSASNSGTGSGTPTVSVTPVDPNCMLWAACNDSVTAVGAMGGLTPTKGADDAQQDVAEYRVFVGSSGAPLTCTLVGSGTYIVGAVAIKPQLVSPTIGSVPSGTPMTAGSLSAPFLFFDTGDYSPGL